MRGVHDERVTIPLDPEEALRALLKVDPAGRRSPAMPENLDGQVLSLGRRPLRTLPVQRLAP
jgi:hypothetical protein